MEASKLDGGEKADGLVVIDVHSTKLSVIDSKEVVPAITGGGESGRHLGPNCQTDELIQAERSGAAAAKP
jgi:hypothetical protein